MGVVVYVGDMTIESVVRTEFNGSAGQVLHYASVNGMHTWQKEIYVAWKHSDETVTCYVLLKSYLKGKTHVKGVSEHDGPTVTQCPASVMKLLTEPKTEHAARWREACVRYLAHAKRRKAICNNLQIGDVVLFNTTYNKSMSAICAGRDVNKHVFVALDGSFRRSTLKAYKSHVVDAVSKGVALDVDTEWMVEGARVQLNPEVIERTGLNAQRYVGTLKSDAKTATMENRVEVPYVQVLWDEASEVAIIAAYALVPAEGV